MTSLLTGSDVMWLLEHDPTTFTHLLELLEDKMAAGLGRSRTLQAAGILNPAQPITAHFLDKVLALRISGVYFLFITHQIAFGFTPGVHPFF